MNVWRSDRVPSAVISEFPVHKPLSTVSPAINVRSHRENPKLKFIYLFSSASFVFALGAFQEILRKVLVQIFS